jgi:glycosyltransferase involved in cell wall biosynthesis
MNKQPLRILQISRHEMLGGAASTAWNLHSAYRRRELRSWMVVGRRETNDSTIFEIPNGPAHALWTRNLTRIRLKLHMIRFPHLGQILNCITKPMRLRDLYKGIEDFDHPGSWRVLELTPEKPDIVHCHNLHAGYFDLRVLPWLCRRVPVMLTLHDAWLLSGHCAHSFDCERWKTGCGQCPDLTIYPAIKRDATANNWRRKRDIYARSRLYVATPSQWLMHKVQQSILASAIVEARVIPNGVNLSVFHPADRQAARAALNLPQDAWILLFVANGIIHNIWKDYQTMRAAVALVAGHIHGQDLLFIALGEKAPQEQIGRAKVHFVPYQKEPETVAQYYQAADVYMHAARVDTFSTTVLEALACGTPVVATSVGGVPEQVEDSVTGFLTPPRDVEAMASRIEQLLTDNKLRWKIGVTAAEVAGDRFNLDRQVDEHLEWFGDIVGQWQPTVRRANK